MFAILMSSMWLRDPEILRSISFFKYDRENKKPLQHRNTLSLRFYTEIEKNKFPRDLHDRVMTELASVLTFPLFASF